MAASDSSRIAWKVIVVAVAVVVLAPPLAFIGGNAMLRRDPSPPAFTEADLPPAPPAESNGWVVLRDHLVELRRGDPPDDVSALLRPLDGGRADELRPWSEVAAVRDRLDAARRSDAARRALAVVDAVLAKPRFVDVCPPGEPGCPLAELARGHRYFALGVLVDAVDGRFVPALERARVMARVVVANAETARTAASAIGSMVLLEAHLELAARLASGIEATSADADPAVREALGAYRTTLAGVDRTKVRLRRGIISEYGYTRRLLLDALAEPGDPGGAGPFARIPAMRDPGDTTQHLDRYFREAVAHATDPEHVAPPMAPRFQGAARWLRNPVGRQLLSIGVADLTRYVARYEQLRTRGFARMDALLARMAGRLGANAP